MSTSSEAGGPEESQVATGILRTEGGPELSPRQLADRGWAAFMTTYGRPDVALRSVEALLDQTFVPATVLVVDNSSEPDVTALAKGLAELGDERVVHVATHENLGSAGGTAFGLQWLTQRGFEWMISVDDDDPPPLADAFERLRALVERNDTPELGIVGSGGTRWSWTRGEQVRLTDDQVVGDLDVDVVGGSSLLTVRRTVIEAIGPPNPRFFFGYYDPLFCLYAKQEGFRILVDGDLLLRKRALAGRLNLERNRSVVPADPPSGLWRRYYVSRNYIYMMRTTLGRRDLARREATKAAARSVTAFRRGPRYGAKYARLQLRGVLDGYRGRLGRRVAPEAKTTRDG